MAERFDPQPVLAGLKDFQRRTVDHVFRRLYEDDPPARRFLVADEVGLGKTVVARGVVARTVRHLQEHPDIQRIDVVYVCSNAAIAAQNLRKLNVLAGDAFSLASRLTLLPLELRDLAGREINFVSFTPGTTFNLKSATGTAEERALLHAMLGERMDLPASGLRNALRAGVGRKSWGRWIRGGHRVLDHDADLAAAFVEAVQADASLREELGEICELFRRDRAEWPQAHRHRRNALVGRLRRTLAGVCVDALEPDLVILDEFQRFRDLLGTDTEAGELAHALMAYPDARVLLLSATPYRMLTLYDEDEEDHYRDFVDTLRFLYGDEEAVREVEALLARFRAGLHGDGGESDLQAARAALQERLRRVMVRTERVRATRRGDAMLREVAVPAPLAPQDLREARKVDGVARALGAEQPLEYWKSAPYLLNFMKGYDLKRRLARHDGAGALGEGLEAAVAEVLPHLLRRADVNRWRALDPGNARLRAFLEVTLGDGQWRLLWTPPSLSYTRPAGVFARAALPTKSLVFSAWNVVPDAIAALASYAVERARVRAGQHAGRYQSLHRDKRALLTFRRGDDGLETMSTLLLLYPSPSLAASFDPLTLALKAGDGLSRSEALRRTRERLGAFFARSGLLRGAPGGRPEPAWHWRALARLDGAARPGLTRWCREPGGWGALLDTRPGEEGEPSAFRDHVARFARALEGDEGEGAPPSDLHQVLAEIALGSPAVCALRALNRVAPGLAGDDPALLRAAADVAEGFRALFNAPDVRCMLESEDARRPYWRQVLAYCIDGNLQALLDEYVHFLRDNVGSGESREAERVRVLGETIRGVLSLRTASLDVDEVRRQRYGLELRPFKVRCRYALRFGDLRSDGDAQVQRAGAVRDAFNSPFRPFVLATTSVGQEGLDFHGYCHRVWHWNLPGNPVDLEQREGRVHRYKGHAVRRNLARRFGLGALRDGWDRRGDPWEVLFAAAHAARPPGLSDLHPYWVYDEGPDAERVERMLPLLPFSREAHRYPALKRALAVYRLAFGQPRQEDLVAWLADREVDPGALELDLSPP